MLVVGSEASSNSQRLVEVARRAGALDAQLIDDAGQLDWAWFEGVEVLGLTAGASAPELLVQDVIAALAQRFEVITEEVDPRRESVTFKLPRALAG